MASDDGFLDLNQFDKTMEGLSKFSDLLGGFGDKLPSNLSHLDQATINKMAAIIDSKIVGLGGGPLGDTVEFLNLAYDAIKDAAQGDFDPLISVIANYGVSMVLSAVVITATIAIAGYFSAGAAAVVVAVWAVAGVVDAISNGAQLLEKILLDLGVLDEPILPGWYAALNALFNPPPRDPLVIDLDGDGIELTSLGASAAYFDLDGDGFAERTGWVGSDDGLLVLDENGNGRIDDIAELFGSATSQGFQELSRLDSNHDNVIDANDAAFLSLQVWRDANGDGVSAPDELHSLNELGIRSLSLETSASGAPLSGNRVLNTSHVTWSNGAQTQSAEIVFTLSQFQSRYVLPENFAYDADVYDLPKLAGYGDLPDLWVAMTQDGALKAEAGAAIETARSGNFGEFLADMDDLLFDWAGVESVRWMGDVDNLYVNFAYDADELAQYLEVNIVAHGGSGPTPPQPKGYVFSMESLDPAKLQAWLAANDLALPPLFSGNLRGVMLNATLPTITFGGGGGTGGAGGRRAVLSLSDLGNQAPPDPTSILPAPALAFLQKIMGQDYSVAGNFLAPDSVMVGEPTVQNAVALMKSFSEVRDYYTSYFLAQAAWSIIAREGPEADLGALAPFKNIFVNPLTDQIDGDFRSLMLQVVDMFRVQDLGSDLDALTLLSVFKGEAPIVALAMNLFDDIDNATIIEAFDLNAIIDGTVDADSLSAVVASVLAGHGGNDTLTGSSGNDTLLGGEGNDALNGGTGNDTYVFDLSDGTDTISDSSGKDWLLMGAGLTAANVFFNVSGSDLLISYGAGDQIRLVNQYYWASTSYQVETLMYGDGTTISLTGGLPIVGGTGNDILNGTNFADTLTGGAGTDTLNGNDGNDTLNGGIANDVLNGGNGNDTYVFSSGDGADTINENSGAGDTIQLGAGLTAANVTFNVSGSDLLISYGAGDQIRLVNQYYWASTSYQVETLMYGDGTTISLTGGLPIVGGTGNDILNGTNFADTLTGNAGTDTLNGNDGNDTLNGGIANDVLNGGNGNDTYVFSSGDGTDTINENSGAGDTIQLGAGLTAANVTFNVSGSDLLISYGAGDQIRLVNQYYWASTSYQVETLMYGDGTTISLTGGLPIVGGTGNDTLNGTAYGDILTGIAGTDTLNGNDGNDTLNGGIANDMLNGGNGNDTYVFSSGDGTDTINENSGAGDTIQLGAGLTAANVFFNVSGSDLLISYGASDQIRLVNQYYWASTSYQVETLIYGDGTTISLTGGLPIVGGAGNDILNGTNFADTLTGGAGTDTLNGNDGNDTLNGGIANDVLNGGSGNDTYVFNSGDGSDTIYDTGGTDTIQLGAGLTAANVTFNVSGSDLLITYGAGDQIKLVDQYYWASTSYQVETLVYGDGTTVSLTGGLPIVGGTGNDTLNGTNGNNALYGLVGDDTLNGNDGDDVLTGGVGSDVLNGGSGNDTYAFSSGDGADIINDNSGTADTIRLGAGLTAANVFFNVSGSDLLITYGAGDQIRLVNQYYWASTSYQVETLIYGDGTTISLTAGLPIVGGTGNDTLNGTNFADTLTGGAGTDTLNGNDGNDTLNGGIANDVLNGGNGNDTYVFSSGDGTDTINENSGAADTIQLGAGLTAANVTFNVSGSDLLISYGAGDQIRLVNQYYWASTSYQVETLMYGDGTTISLTGGLPIVGGTGNDILNGTNFADTLTGNAGTDTLNGNDGNDTLNGGIANDVLNGGNGNDTYVFSSGDGTDTINENSGAGDTIQLGAGLTAANVTFNVSGSDLLISYGAGDQIRLVNQYYWASTSYQVETLMYGDGTTISLTGGLPIVGGTGNDTLNGTAYGDILTGNAGTDTLNGNDGNDTLNGGIANDMLNGGNGNDTYVFSSGDGTDTINENSGAGDTIQLGAGLTAANVFFNVSGSDLLISYGASDQIRLVNQYYWASTSYQVETLIYGDGTTISLTGGLPIVGGAGNDILNGTNFADTLTGGAGTDTLNGNDGNDTLNGGIANDMLNGGNGNDTYVFSSGDGTDTINENSGAGDTIQLGAGLTAANVTFNVSASGNDLLISDGVGGDLLKLTYQYYSAGYQIETLIYGDGTTISLTGGLPIAGGAGNDTLNGTGFGDTLSGGDGADTLNGYAGNDTLTGGIGTDALNGGSGNDTYVFNSGDGSDTIYDTSGTDTIQLGAGLTAANVTFNVSASGNDLLISDGVGGDLIKLTNQYYSAGYQIEILIYGDGTTISLTGGLPIVGGAGNDTLNGTGFGDTLSGGDGADTLNGYAGNDTLTGGIGTDALNGGSGNDTYVFNSGDGSDTIYDTSGTDTIQLGAGLTAANVTFNVSASGNDLLISDGVGGDLIKLTNQYYSAGYQIETLIYGDGTTISLTGGLPIVGGAGNDTLNGTGFGDTLSAGDGADTLNGYAGNDTLTGGIGTDALNGGSGNDTYVFNSGDGSDTIYDTSGTDTIQLGAGLTAANVTFNVSASGNDLLISDGVGGDLIKLTNQYYSAGYQIETLIYGDGTTISLTGGLPIVGGTGNDILNGGSAKEALYGFAGIDVLNGGAGNDTLSGGADSDTFIFQAGFGKDTISDFIAGAGSEDVIDFATNVFADFASVLAAATQVGADTIITHDASNVVTLKNVAMANLHQDDFQFIAA
ncbi:hypothetical protein HB777_04005 [Mesorhizobium loti]|nr:hypothetical protein HB777_04005 [Mesorhizobium loti]